MKKNLFTLALALLCSTALVAAQDDGTTIDLEIAGRLDSNPHFTLGQDGSVSHNFANSGFYTNLDMYFGEHWHVNLVNHWLSDGASDKFLGGTPDLYRNLTYSVCNFLDYLYVEYITSGWTFRLGKECQLLYGWENEPWDWEVVYDLASNNWMCNNSYQWGGSVSWTNPSENTFLSLQALSSSNDTGIGDPWKIWHKGYGVYSFKHSGEYGNFITSNSISWKQIGPAQGIFTGGIGLGGVVNDALTIRGDVSGQYGTGSAGPAGFNARTMAEVLWNPSEKWGAHFRAGLERFGLSNTVAAWMEEDPSEVPAINAAFIGGSVSYYPLHNSRDLRIIGAVSYNSTFHKKYYASTSSIGVTLGILYDHVFHIK